MLYIDTDKIEVKKTKVTLTISNHFESNFNAVVDKQNAFTNLICLSLLAGESSNILKQLGQENVDFKKISDIKNDFNELISRMKGQVKIEPKSYKFQ